MDPRDLPAFLRRMHDLEDRYKSASREDLPANAVPYLPYPVADFVTLLTEAVMAAGTGGQDRPIRYLEAGCGPGTKMAIAEALFGLDVHGFDIQPSLAAVANDGRDAPVAEVADAASWDRYGDADIVYYSRPVDGGAMIAAERHVMGQMRPGAVLISVFGWTDPAGDLGWRPVYVRSLTPVTGVWVKP